MATIDERANAWAENHRECYTLDAPYLMEMSYHQGATEQKTLDDEEYRKSMVYMNVKKQELMDRVRKAYCAHHCKGVVVTCWKHDEERPCEGWIAVNKAMEE